MHLAVTQIVQFIAECHKLAGVSAVFDPYLTLIDVQLMARIVFT